MSSINFSSLKSPTDEKIPYVTRVVPFTTSDVLDDALLTFGKIIKNVKVFNEDSANSVEFTNISNSNESRTVPPSTAIDFPEWTSFFKVEPSGTTGEGKIEIDLVKPEDAEQNG